jgi:hypothetical protein
MGYFLFKRHSCRKKSNLKHATLFSRTEPYTSISGCIDCTSDKNQKSEQQRTMIFRQKQVTVKKRTKNQVTGATDDQRRFRV